MDEIKLVPWRQPKDSVEGGIVQRLDTGRDTASAWNRARRAPGLSVAAGSSGRGWGRGGPPSSVWATGTTAWFRTPLCGELLIPGEI